MTTLCSVLLGLASKSISTSHNFQAGRFWKSQREEVHLLTRHDLSGLRGRLKISFVCIRFLCEDNAGVKAFLRVYMQIPHAGTKMVPAEARRSQAGRREHDEVIAYKRFGQKGAEYMPKGLGYKLNSQPSDSILVPGGYEEYILWEKVPGVHLNSYAFWGLDAQERDDIVNAFKPAYKELLDCGIQPVFDGPSHMVWDKENKPV